MWNGTRDEIDPYLVTTRVHEFGRVDSNGYYWGTPGACGTIIFSSGSISPAWLTELILNESVSMSASGSIGDS